MRINLPLILAVGGCIFFGLSNIYVIDRAISAVDSLRGLNVAMAFASYKKGCLDIAPENAKNKCQSKALDHKNEIIEIHNKMDAIINR